MPAMARAHSVVLPSVLYWRTQRGLTQENWLSGIAMPRTTIWRIETHRRVSLNRSPAGRCTRRPSRRPKAPATTRGSKGSEFGIMSALTRRQAKPPRAPHRRGLQVALMSPIGASDGDAGSAAMSAVRAQLWWTKTTVEGKRPDAYCRSTPVAFIGCMVRQPWPAAANKTPIPWSSQTSRPTRSTWC